MEALIVLAVAAVILLILGVSGLTVMKVIMIVLGAVLALMILFFTVCAAALLLSRRCRGHFVRFDKSGRFETAVYGIDGEEYANIFPAEPIMRGIIYKPGERTLFLFRRGKRSFAFDTHSVMIVAAGFALSVGSLSALIYTSMLVSMV